MEEKFPENAQYIFSTLDHNETGNEMAVLRKLCKYREGISRKKLFEELGERAKNWNGSSIGRVKACINRNFNCHIFLRAVTYGENSIQKINLKYYDLIKDELIRYER